MTGQLEMFPVHPSNGTDGIFKDAVISECGNYRHALTRIWDRSKEQIMFIGLNPSTADADNDDPTLRRCMNFANDWGYGGLFMLNLFDYRATDPHDLFMTERPESELCNYYLSLYGRSSDTIVFAWGSFKPNFTKHRVKVVREMFGADAYCFGNNNNGAPKHPLYLASDTLLTKFL